MNPKPYLSELLGTFTLTLAVSLGLMGNLGLPVPVLAGLTLGLFVYTVGWISGAHLNPAVTVALATIKKIGVNDAVYYMLAQFVGAIVASFVVVKLAGDAPSPTIVNSAWVTIAEAIGAFLLLWGIMSVVEGKVSKGASGLVIGSSLTLGVMVAAATGSNGVLNPAVAFGIHSFSSAYLIGPVVGTIAAAWLYRWFMEPVHVPAHRDHPGQ